MASTADYSEEEEGICPADGPRAADRADRICIRVAPEPERGVQGLLLQVEDPTDDSKPCIRKGEFPMYGDAAIQAL